LQRRLKISSKDLKYVLAFFIITTIVVSASVYLQLEAAPTDQFFSMWILGANGLTENYFPNNNPNLIVGETVNWTLGIYNHNSALQYVVLRVKLLNATQIAPNELTGAPSPVDAIFEFARVLTSNETWAVPFVWAIMNETNFRGSLKITGLMINQTLITGNLGEANSGLNFRMVFELWFYDPATDRLAFSQTTTTASYSIWTQLWFNATAT
jgi:hypothetical protein